MKSVWLSFAGACLGAVLSVSAQEEKVFGGLVRSGAVAFVQSLDAGRAALCLQTNDRPARWAMQYTGGKRAGLQVSAMPPPARERLEALLQLLLSEEGWRQARAVADQDGGGGLGRYYVALFGDPREGDFALRVAEHHLTLVHLELAQGEVAEFGPILLGCDPPALWQEEEKALLGLWSTLGAGAARDVLPGRGIASETAPLADGRGIAIASLDPSARAAFDRVWSGRLAFFSEPVRARIGRLVEARGGLASLRMAYFNEEATLRCRDGGRWDWKLVGPGLLMDFETSRKHIHMSLWIR